MLSTAQPPLRNPLKLVQNLACGVVYIQLGITYNGLADPDLFRILTNGFGPRSVCEIELTDKYWSDPFVAQSSFKAASSSRRNPPRYPGL